jgi:RNA-binding protein
MHKTPDRKLLRTVAHSLNPVVTVAEKGLSENVNNEIDRALRQHELIKVKIFAADRAARQAVIEIICEQQKALLVQRIGNIAVLYRAAEKPDPKLSNRLRYKA